jgi:hypothetical protein
MSLSLLLERVYSRRFLALQNMMVVCKDRLDKLGSTSDRAGPVAAAPTTAAVEAEIASLLSGKSYEQLVQLQRQIQNKLTSGEPVDVDYWEGLLKSLLVWKSKVRTAHSYSLSIRSNSILFQAKLKSLHEVVVQNRLEQLRKRQRDEALQAQAELLAGVGRLAGNKNWGGDMRAEAMEPIAEAPDEIAVEVEQEHYERGMSPPLIDITRLSYEERQVDIVDELADRRALVRHMLHPFPHSVNHAQLFCSKVLPAAFRGNLAICPEGYPIQRCST